MVALLVLAAALTAQQVPAQYEKPTGYLSDFAHVVDAADADAIEQYASSLRTSTGAEVALVTVRSLNGEPVEDFANNLYRKWGIGQKGANEGLLILLAIDDRKSRVEVGYGLEPILTDGYVGSVQRQIRPELREGKYGAALRKALEAFGAKIQQAKGTLSSEVPAEGRAGPPRVQIPGRFLMLLLIVVVLFLFFSGGGGGRRGGGGVFWPGPFLGGGGGFGGSSGGGWGSGGGGGGSFGGFGGGDSGGGGSSSDW